MGDPLRIIVCGLVGQYPVGGVAWDYLQYLVGLHDLGHDVVYHEDTWTWPYHPVERRRTNDGSYSARFIESFLERHAPDLRSRWHYQHLQEDHHGMTAREFDRFAASADVFLNVSGASTFPRTLASGCRTVFLDTDPGYNQIVLAERPAWAENIDRWADLVAAHECHATYAENINNPSSRVPRLGYEWITTRMPVVRRLWESVPPAPSTAPWTTVMTWNSFGGPLSHAGREYGAKGREFFHILDLPRRTGRPFRLALGGVNAPAASIREGGWEVVDGPRATLTADAYKAFIASSRGECSVAKNVYVALRTGWFSTRSACYLAAGRPVVVQDTGLSADLRDCVGLIAFEDADGAASALEAVEGSYEDHAAGARDVAMSFAAAKVLRRLLDDIGGC